MKKIIACLLTIILVLGTMTPAMAADDYYASPPTYSDWLYPWMEENPDIVEEILKDDPPLWAEWGYDSLEEMLYDFGMTEEEYYYDYVLYEGAWEYYYADYSNYYAKWVADMRESMGAPRSGLAVMVNNEYISFPDAQPELSNGRTMLPIRALMEALGASVDYTAEGSIVTAELNGVTFRFTVGESQITVIENNVSQVIQMDCKTYIKDGRTYVPVRFFSEAAGYDVIWDSDFETAVIFDREAIIAELNKDFTIINKLFAANELDPSRTYKTVADISAVITSFSTLDGNLSANINVKATVISNGEAQNVALSCDLESLLNLLSQRGGIYLYDDELEAIAAFSDINVELIANSDEQESYIKFPALTDVLGYGEDVWLKIDGDIIGGELSLTDTDAFYSGGISVGELIYDNIISHSSYEYSYYHGVFYYGMMLEAANEAENYFGDVCFTKNGNSWSWSLDRDSYEMLMYGSLPYYEYSYDFKELDISLTITENAGKLSVAGSFNIRDTAWDYGEDAKITGTFSMTPEYLNASFTVHVNNSYKVDIDLRISVTEATQSIATAPPEGSVILDFDP